MRYPPECWQCSASILKQAQQARRLLGEHLRQRHSPGPSARIGCLDCRHDDAPDARWCRRRVGAHMTAGAQPTLSPPQRLGRDLLRALVETNTTHATGSTTTAAELLAARFVAAEFRRAHVQVAESAPSKGNLVVRYASTTPGKSRCSSAWGVTEQSVDGRRLYTPATATG